MPRWFPVLLLVWVCGLATSVVAQNMTAAQLQTLKTDITVTNASEFAPLLAIPDYPGIAAAYNTQASPMCWVWKNILSKKDFLFSASVDATTFTFVGNGYFTIPQGERDGFNQLFSGESPVMDPSLQKVRDAVEVIFSGAGNAAANRAHFTAIGRRPALRAEKLYATGGTPPGNCSTATPSTMTRVGTISHIDVQQAVMLP